MLLFIDRINLLRIPSANLSEKKIVKKIVNVVCHTRILLIYFYTRNELPLQYKLKKLFPFEYDCCLILMLHNTSNIHNSTSGDNRKVNLVKLTWELKKYIDERISGFTYERSTITSCLIRLRDDSIYS